MFNTLRKHSKTVIWLIIIAFILWGASSLLVSQNRSTSYAGEVFGRKVSYKEYNDISKMLSVFKPPLETSQTGTASDDEIWLYIALKREAEQTKIPADDESVRLEIQKMFGMNELFDPRRYEEWVRDVLKENPRNFEELVRTQIRIRKLIQSVAPQNAENPAFQEWVTALLRRARIKKY
ncbi:MAG: SurA N-terminal domain-containing protein [Candidatus Omnitrophica bacterium]|nr:SurA N-terminal domain-containing protein [Candidatus Omnitrophota bacterium]